MAQAETKTEKTQKEIRCFVTSDKMTKSRVAMVERIVKHETYGKYIRRRTKVMFHDEKNETRIGDEVAIAQTRRLSANKKFSLVRIINKA